MLANIKLGPKLIGSFLVVAMIAMLVGIFGYFQIHKIDDADTQLYEKGLNPTAHIGVIAANFHRLTNNIHQISEVVQDTASGAQESASAASQLAGNAEELQRLVGMFKL